MEDVDIHENIFGLYVISLKEKCERTKPNSVHRYEIDTPK